MHVRPQKDSYLQYFNLKNMQKAMTNLDDH